MSNSKINIKQVSKLANLPLTADEEQLYEKQLSSILDYVKQIESADTKNIEPTFNITLNNNITRADTASKTLTQKEAISNSPVNKNGFIITKGVFENE